MSIISFKQVHYTYPGDELESLCGVDLEIEQGEFVAVLGHNGSGKSTLAKHMNAILVPDEGKVVVDGIDSSEEDDVYQIRRRVGMVFQNPDNQIVANVVEDDVAFAPENLGVRVAIAGVIAMQPKIIVLDEPTAMLDPQGREEVLSTVTKLCREKGMTVVLITHHMDECVGADKLVIMSNGYIKAVGTPAEIFSDVEMMAREGLAVPETTKLLYELNGLGFSLPLGELDEESCAAAIAAAIKKE